MGLQAGSGLARSLSYNNKFGVDIYLLAVAGVVAASSPTFSVSRITTMFTVKSWKHILFRIKANRLICSRVSLLQNPYFSSISQQSLSDPNPAATIDFLVKSCGLSLDKAMSVSKKLKPISQTDKPQLVVKFLENNGFSKTHIAKIVSLCHQKLLFSDVEKTLRPKLEHIQQTFGLSEAADLIASKPHILFRSLENEIIPCIERVRRNVSTNENVLKVLKRCHILSTNIDPNMDVLRALAVPESRISYLLMTQPGVLSMKPESFKINVEAVEKMGFQPGSKMFTTALHARSSMSTQTWDSKIKLLKDLGWSLDQIFEAFKRLPLFLTCSEEKMKRGLDLFMNKLKWDISVISKNPKLVLFSLESRVIPRLSVCKILMSRQKVKKDVYLFKMLMMAEETFLKICMEHPDLLKIYKARYKLDDAATLVQDWPTITK